MDELRAMIDAILHEVPTKTVGEFIKTDQVYDWLIDLRTLCAAQEPVPV